MADAVIDSEFDDSAEVNPYKKKQVVIFFAESTAFVGDPNDDKNMLIFRSKMNEVTNTGVHSIVALSKADLASYKLDSGADNTEFEKYRVKAANFFGLGQNQVFPLVTYANFSFKNFEIDRLILDVLLRAFNAAKIIPSASHSDSNNEPEDEDWMFNQ